MEYVIGIDSGGTNYRIKAASLDGATLAYFVGNEANHYHIGRDEMRRRVDSHFSTLLKMFGGSAKDCKYIVCGTTGLDSPEDEEYLTSFYENIEGFDCPVKVINDAELAHYTVTGGEGVLIISGTGSIAFASDKQNNHARAGGYLFTILGDEGSGSWVSRAALQHLGRYFDGAVEETYLVDLLQQRLGIIDRNGLNRLAFSMGNMPWTCPKVGDLVDEASKTDVFAKSILEKAASYLIDIVSDVVSALSLSEKEPDFKLGLWGSNLLHSKVLKNSFISLAKERYPECKIIEADIESIDGSIKMALELLSQTR